MNHFKQGLLLKQSDVGDMNQFKELNRREDLLIEFDIEDTTLKQTRQTTFTKSFDEHNVIDNKSISFLNIGNNACNASNSEEVFTYNNINQFVEQNKQNIAKQNELEVTIISSNRSNMSSDQKEGEYPLKDYLEMSFNGQDVSPNISQSSSFAKSRISKQSKYNQEFSIKSKKKMTNEQNDKIISIKDKDNQIQNKNKAGQANQFGKKQKINNLCQFNLIAKIMKKMLYFYRNYTYSGKTKYTNLSLIRQLINDKSDVSNTTKQKIKLDIFKKKWKQIKNQFMKISIIQTKMINPQNLLSIYIQIFYIAANFLYFLFLSILLVFTQQEFSSRFDTYIIIQWIVEIFVKLNTAVFIKTNYIDTRKDVVNIYFQNNAIFDISSIVFLLIQTDLLIFQYILKIISFVKLVNTLKDKQQIEKQLLMILRNHYIVQLINLIIQLLFVGHVLSCIWYFIAKIDLYYLDKEKSWMSLLTNDGDDWSKIYILSFYWSFTLMSTGSNVANTTLEVYFTSFAILFTTISFLLYYQHDWYHTLRYEQIRRKLKKRYQCYQQLHAEKRHSKKIESYQEQCQNIQMKEDHHKFLKHFLLNSNRTLQRRVNLDLENYYLNNLISKAEEEKQVLNKISSELNEALKIEYNQNIFSQIKLLYDNFSEDTLKQLCLEAEEVYYSPEQIICKEGDFSQNLMYIVSGTGFILILMKNNCGDSLIKNKEESQQPINRKFSQKVNNLTKQNNLMKCIFKSEWGKQLDGENCLKKLEQLKKGEIFGELNFFTGILRNENVKSKDFTTILKIDRQHFIEIIKNKEKDFQSFCEIKDRLILYNDFSSIKKQCTICNSSFHMNNFCNLTHFNKENQFIIQKFNKSLSLIQERNQTFVRKKQKVNFQTIILDGGDIHISKDMKKQWLKKNTLYSLNLQHTQYTHLDEESLDEEEKEDTNGLYYFQTIVEPHNDLFNNIQSQNIEKEGSSLLSSQHGSQQNKSHSHTHDYLVSQKNQNTSSSNNPRFSIDLSEENQSKSYNNFQIIKRIHDNAEEHNIEKYKKQLNFNNDDLLNLHDINMNAKIPYNEESKKRIIPSVERLMIPKSNKQVSIKQIPFINVQSILFDKQKQKQKYQSSDNSLAQQNKILHIEWIFDQQKDFEYYFPSGNQRNILTRLLIHRRLQNKRIISKEQKNVKKLDITKMKQISA